MALRACLVELGLFQGPEAHLVVLGLVWGLPWLSSRHSRRHWATSDGAGTCLLLGAHLGVEDSSGGAEGHNQGLWAHRRWLLVNMRMQSPGILIIPGGFILVAQRSRLAVPGACPVVLGAHRLVLRPRPGLHGHIKLR